MFYHECGSKVLERDRFCVGCGASINLHRAELPGGQTIPFSLPSLHLERKGKIRLASAVGVVGILAIGYAIAHYTYGPSSPVKLEKKALAAISKKDVYELSKYLSPESAEIKKKEVLDTFQNAFDEKTASTYERYFKNAAKAVDSSKGKKGKKEDNISDILNNLLNSGSSSGSPVQFTSQKSWRGTKWSYVIQPAAVSFTKDDTWTVSTTLGALKETEGSFSNLWPANYAYEAEVSNSFGGSETVKGNVDLLNMRKSTVDLNNQVKTKLSLTIPNIKDFTFTLNGVPIALKNNNSYDRSLTIRPAPKEAKVQAKGSVLGKPVDETMTVTPNTIAADVGGMVNQAVAKMALDVIYNGVVSWADAYNSNDASKMKLADPKGTYYQNASRNLNASKAQDNKITFEKLAVSPENITISDKEIRIKATEQYVYEKEVGLFNPSRVSVANNEYRIQKMPDKEEWWITSSSTSYFSGNILEDKKALKKENAAARTASN